MAERTEVGEHSFKHGEHRQKSIRPYKRQHFERVRVLGLLHELDPFGMVSDLWYDFTLTFYTFDLSTVSGPSIIFSYFLRSNLSSSERRRIFEKRFYTVPYFCFYFRFLRVGITSCLNPHHRWTSRVRDRSPDID